MITEELLNKCTSTSEKETALFFDSIGLKCIDLSFKIHDDKNKVTGEIDGIFIDEENEVILIYDDSKQQKKSNDKITKFFTKWLNQNNESKIFEKLTNLPYYPIHILYINKFQNRDETDQSSIEYLLKANTSIIHKDDFEYFLHLSDNIGKWTKNDLYNFINIFPPQKRIEIEATQIYIGNIPAYIFADRPDRILKYSYVSRRRDQDEGYQRMVDIKRVKEIKTALEDGSIIGFPNSILLNSTVVLNPTPYTKSQCPKQVKIAIPNHYSSCRIVDGQHRVLSFSLLSQPIQTKFNLPIVLIDNMPISEEIKMFLEINNNAKSVDTNLEYELTSKLEWDITTKNHLIKIGVKIVNELEKKNPLKGNIYKGIVGDIKKEKITLLAIVNSIIKNKFIDFNGGILQKSEDVNDVKNPASIIQIVLTEINKLSIQKDYFFSNRGIELTFNYLNIALKSLDILKNDFEDLLSLKTKDLIEVVDKNIDDLKKYQGAQGNKDALVLVETKIAEKGNA
ncbi:MAG: DGQHR domain-containing protein [Bacteroidota bacterium]